MAKTLRTGGSGVVNGKPISVFVHGTPRAKQSFMVTGRGRGITPLATREWQKSVFWAVVQVCLEAEHIPNDREWYSVKLVFVLSGKASPDIDNLTKAVLDACNGAIWINDRQVQSLVAYKVNLPAGRRSETGVFIEAQATKRFNETMLEKSIMSRVS